MSLPVELSEFMASYYGLCAGYQSVLKGNKQINDFRGQLTKTTRSFIKRDSYLLEEPRCPVDMWAEITNGSSQVMAWEKVLLLDEEETGHHFLWHGKDDEDFACSFYKSNSWTMGQYRFFRPVLSAKEYGHLAMTIGKTTPNAYEWAYLEESSDIWEYVSADKKAQRELIPEWLGLPAKTRGDSVQVYLGTQSFFVNIYEDGSMCFRWTSRRSFDYTHEAKVYVFWDAEDNSLYLRMAIGAVTWKSHIRSKEGPKREEGTWPERALKAAPWLLTVEGYREYSNLVTSELTALKTYLSVNNGFMHSVYYTRFLRGEISKEDLSEFGGSFNRRSRQNNIEDLIGYLLLSHDIVRDSDRLDISLDSEGHSASGHIRGAEVMGFACASRVSAEIYVSPPPGEYIGLKTPSWKVPPPAIVFKSEFGD